MDKFKNGEEDYSVILTDFTEEVAAALKHYFICDTESCKNIVKVIFPNGQKFFLSVAEIINVN